MFVVVSRFADLEDHKHLYNVGDTYPRDGISVPNDRVLELLGNNNKLRKPLIKEVKDKPSKSKSRRKKT